MHDEVNCRSTWAVWMKYCFLFSLALEYPHNNLIWDLFMLAIRSSNIIVWGKIHHWVLYTRCVLLTPCLLSNFLDKHLRFFVLIWFIVLGSRASGPCRNICKICNFIFIFFIQVVKTVYASPSRVNFHLDSRKVSAKPVLHSSSRCTAIVQHY